MKKTISLLLCLIFIFGSIYCVYADNGEMSTAAASSESGAPVSVNAPAYVLMDANTGTLLAEKNSHEKMYPASITKVMTLLLVCEAIDSGTLSYDEVLSCSETAAAKGGSQIWLEPNEKMSVRDLLKAAVIYSANDACTLLGETIGGSEQGFVNLMNKKAAELGMKDTHFDNCTGLDDDTTTHLTTAYDIALMSRELIRFSFIKDYTTIWMDELRGGKTQLVNTNRLIRYYPGATGLKTGTTSKAGCCVSATAKRDDLELIAVVLGAENSNNRFNGAKNLLDYGFANYKIYRVSIDDSMLCAVPVRHGIAFEVNTIAKTQEELLIKKESGNVSVTTEIAESVEAPVEKGSVLGSVLLRLDGNELATYDIVAAEDVAKLTFLPAILRLFRSLSYKKL